MTAKGTGSGSGHRTDGKEPGSSRLTSRKQRAKKGQAGWDDCDSQLLQEVIARVVEEGALISFSKTLDGGALVLYIKDGSEETKDYPSSADAIEEALKDIHLTYSV